MDSGCAAVAPAVVVAADLGPDAAAPAAAGAGDVAPLAPGARPGAGPLQQALELPPVVEQPVEAAMAAAGADLAALRAAAQLLQAAGTDPAVLRAAAQLLHAAGAAPEDAAAGPAVAAAHRASIAAGKQPVVDAAGKQPVVDAASDTAWTGLGMPPADAPLSAIAIRGQPADAALAAALLAAKSEASAAQERVRAASLAWECERFGFPASASPM
ncbi:transcriptional regulatory protein AlgP-like [Panicum virgatum]|uniref:transcriptional regulatory protein AlgP-like n=1 Tax=Panicum virgatum TaxID=38727 RepID=UPI0019D65E23|nr:transcriptional regulatory protein AlgP-like [Panicum virgatum]